MQRILFMAAVLCVAGAVAAQTTTPKARPGAGGPRTDLANDDAIRKVAAGHDGRAFGAIRVHGVNATRIQLENEETRD